MQYFKRIQPVSLLLCSLIAILAFTLFACQGRNQKVTFTVNSPAPQPVQNKEKPEKLYFDFIDSVALIEMVGKNVTSGIKISPDLAGVWQWESDTRLSFEPAEDWPLGMTYKIDFSRDLFRKDKPLATYSQTVQIERFMVDLTRLEYYISPENPDEKRVLATLKYNYPVNLATVENKIELKVTEADGKDKWYKNKKLQVRMANNDTKTELYLISEILPLPMETVKVQLNVDGGMKSLLGGGAYDKKLTNTVAIPGMSSYVKIKDLRMENIRADDYTLQQMLIFETQGDISSKNLMANLKVYLLPVDKYDIETQKTIANYNWVDVKYIGRQDLERSQLLSLEASPTEREYTPLNSFRFKAPVNRRLYVRLEEKTPFYGGYILPKTYETVIYVQPIPKEIRILHDGSILSLSGSRTISLMAYDVAKVKFEIGRLLPDQINHLISQSNGQIKNLRFMNDYYFDENNISEKSYEILTLQKGGYGEPQFFSFDFSSRMGEGSHNRVKDGVFFFKVHELTADNKTTGLYDARLILITDLGLLVKNNSGGSHDLFLQSIASGYPVDGAKVEVIAKNGLPVATKYTDDGGHAAFPSLASFTADKEPVAYVVSKGNDLSFMPFHGGDRWLDYSNFEIDGIHENADPAKLNAYLFSDRGLYRPGDTMNVGIIVKSFNWQRSLSGLPLLVSIVDSRGIEVYSETIRLGAEGLQSINYKTEYTSPTGVYQIDVYHIVSENKRDFLGTTDVRVEEFIPDRLKLETSFTVLPAKGWLKTDKLTGEAKLANLFGTPAVGHNMKATFTLLPAYFSFPAYRDYKFSDPYSAKNSYTEPVMSSSTDEAGEASFDLDLTRFEKASFNVNFTAEGFEKDGGRSVISDSSILVSPLEYIIGSKPDGDLSYIYKDAERNIEFIAIDANTDRIAVKGINIQVKKINWVSVLMKREDNTYKYQSVKKYEIKEDKKYNIDKAAGLVYRLRTDEPGEFELLVTDAKGLELNKLGFTVVSKSNISRSLVKNAELKLHLSKPDYEQGEELEVFVQAPYTGAGLITIERDKVYAHKWFRADSNSTIQTIRVPETLEGNAYVNVSFIRAADSTEIYMSPLSYGIQNFSISRKKRTIDIGLEIPPEARPGTPFAIKYRTSRPAKIIVYAIDEGILQVANYKTPDPLSFFFKKRALEVKTAQLLDLILPDISIIRQLQAMGGSGDYDALGKNLNPFKRKDRAPVAFWSGIIDAGADQRQIVYNVPSYFNGTLHVFAVAVSTDAIGVKEDKAFIKDYFVINPNAPLFASPGDTFKVTVTVANNIKGSGKTAKVAFSCQTSSHLTANKKTETMTIEEGRDATVEIDCKVNNVMGSAELVFTSQLNDYKSTFTESLSIRPPVPYRTELTTGRLKNTKKEIATPRSLYPQYRTKNFTASFLPVGLSQGLITYLDEYPYGCSEQVTSKAFPYIVLSQHKLFNLDFKLAQTKAAEAIRILRARQNSNGSFGLWEANDYTSLFLNAYIVHFLTEAVERGFYVPEAMLESGLDYLAGAQSQEASDYYTIKDKAYAIYVLTRNSIVTTNYITALREVMDKEYKNWKTDLPGLYIAASLRLMKDEKNSTELFRGLRPMNKENWEPECFYNRYIFNSQYFYIGMLHFPVYITPVTNELVDSMTTALDEGFYNTIISSYSIMAFALYTGESSAGIWSQVSLKEKVDKKTEVLLPLNTDPLQVIGFSDKAQALVLDNRNNNNLYYQVVEAGFDTQPPASKITKGVEVYKEYKDRNGNMVKKVTLGDEIDVHLKFRGLAEDQDNMVIIDLLPAGFDLVSDAPAGGNWTPEYTDKREERIILYGCMTKSLGEYIYRIKAVNQGTFTVPPVFAENMYDKKVQGLTPSKESLTIVK